MRCLRDIHKIKTVGEMKNFRDLLAMLSRNHKARKNCACGKCREMRQEGCHNPHKCSCLARVHLSRLKRKWNSTALEEARTTSKAERQ